MPVLRDPCGDDLPDLFGWLSDEEQAEVDLMRAECDFGNEALEFWFQLTVDVYSQLELQGLELFSLNADAASALDPADPGRGDELA